MTRPRRSSGASDDSVGTVREQELGSMYDYLAKIILLGPSGTGKSCLLHRFVKNEWRVLSSQTIGVEFASKIIKVGSGSRRKRIKLQLWDTAGTERFRSVSRSYYRGAAGAILVYDLTSHVSFNALQPFLNDARALASPQLSLLLVGNKLDLATEMPDTGAPSSTVPSSYASTSTMQAGDYPSYSTSTITSSGSASMAAQASTLRATVAPEGREVSTAVANRWASQVGVPVVMEASALSGDQVDEVFERLARMIVTKIEIGDIDPDDPLSGIQYGDGYGYSAASIRGDGASVKNSLNGVTVDDGSANEGGTAARGVEGMDNLHFKGQDASPCRHPDVAPDWLPVAQFPTNIHLDLLHHGLISDPFTSKNESLVQWVGETSWIYRKTFDLPGDKDRPGLGPMGDATADAAVCADLLFHGLDTVASVSLNGIEILQADNMFVPHRICCVACRARTSVAPATTQMGLLERREFEVGGAQGTVSLELHVGHVYITDLSAQININLTPISASVNIATETKGVGSVLSQTSVHVTLALDDYHQTKVVSHGDSAHFELPHPRLWYPAKYGPQPLYTVTVLVMDDKGHIYDRQEKRIGLRKVELNQESLQGQQGTSFFFRVNGIPVFCGGSNWIPADSFLPRLNSNKYHAWMKLLRDGNQVMVRVWGGGVYENDTFYDACDELGILVWQDFMFACGNYPASPEMLKSVESEARANVIRLRHHPSIVVWAGNNEDYQYQESEGLTYDPDNKDPQSWLKTDFPARYIYEHLLPRPMGAVKAVAIRLSGDIHQWNVWHGTQERYQNFDKLAGRFVSEFGMEAFPSTKTIDSFLPRGKDDPDRYAQSSTLDFHNKATGHERRLALYLVENLRYALDPLEAYVYATQLMQAECLSYAYRLFKRQWQGPGKEYCAGALVWQLNDCWPVTSWSICDYYLRPKLAYYAIKREMAALSVGAFRKEGEQNRKVQVWACNLALERAEVDLEVKGIHVETGAELFKPVRIGSMVLRENRSTELLALDIEVQESEDANSTIVAVYLQQDGKRVARHINWPEPLKYLHLQQPKDLCVTLSADYKSVVDEESEEPMERVAEPGDQKIIAAMDKH
ncbi:putative glycoside hydrolase family 2 protein [Ceratocystis lukuohia]|uniref:Beta-mannosidase B n=1 Tax=Ceratocystis lukuohia TaxID=2019550 RepID=A0ABR4MMP5_9PEZI